MQEPDLEEESLSASLRGDRLEIRRRSVDPDDRPIEMTRPDGEVVTVELEETRPGLYTASLPVDQPGLYRISDGINLAMAAVGALNPLEFADVRTSEAKAAVLAGATGGSVSWLSDGVPDIDGSDGAALSQAEIAVRSELEEQLRLLREEFPETTLVETASIIGVRETRRIVGRYMITEQDALTGRPLPDSIAVCSNPMPSYNGSRFFFDHLGFEIPYRSLVTADLDNVLLAGRCISASQPAFQSARSMAPNMAISQATGTAAAMSVSTDCRPADLDVAALQEQLESDGAVVRIPPEERQD